MSPRSRAWGGAEGAATSDLAAADRDTLSHLLHRGMGENSLRALRSNLRHLEAWSEASTGRPLDWPPTAADVLRFVAHHLWDTMRRARDPDHGMSEAVRHALRDGGYLRTDWLHASAAVERRIASWHALRRGRQAGEGPFAETEVRRTLRAAVRAAARPRRRHSLRTVDAALMGELLDQLDEIAAQPPEPVAEVFGARLSASCDRALLTTMFASGGRRRSEIAALAVGDVHLLEPNETGGAGRLRSIDLSVDRTKTTTAAEDRRVFVTGRAADALENWISAGIIRSGPVFRAVDRWGHVGTAGIAPAAVNAVLKARLAGIGRDPREFSAHGVRAGYVTEAFRAGIPAPEVMEQTLHRSMDVLLGYFRTERQREGRAARLL